MRSLLDMYQPVREAGRLFLVISIAVCSVSPASGFYSLLAYAIQPGKIYETGIRKVLGADISQIMFIRRFRNRAGTHGLPGIPHCLDRGVLPGLWRGSKGIHYHIDMQLRFYFLISPLILLVVVTF